MPQKLRIFNSFAATEYSSSPVISLPLYCPRWEKAGVIIGESNLSPKNSIDVSATTESMRRSSIRIESIYFSVITFASDILS